MQFIHFSQHTHALFLNKKTFLNLKRLFLQKPPVSRASLFSPGVPEKKVEKRRVTQASKPAMKNNAPFRPSILATNKVNVRSGTWPSSWHCSYYQWEYCMLMRWAKVHYGGFFCLLGFPKPRRTTSTSALWWRLQPVCLPCFLSLPLRAGSLKSMRTRTLLPSTKLQVRTECGKKNKGRWIVMVF